MYTGSATARVPGGGFLTGGKVTVTLGDVGVHKLCVSNVANPWLDDHFTIATGELNGTGFSAGIRV